MLNPYKITEPTCISFSGGRTSAYMLYQVLQAHGGTMPDDAIVCFANTGKEEEATLKFVNDCSVNWGVPIIWLEYQAENPKFKVVDYASASRNGEPFAELITKRSYLPNAIARFCTSELKVLAIDRYMKSINKPDYDTLVGIRADEPRRVAKMRVNADVKLTPLATQGVTQAIVWDFWNKQTFDLELAKFNGASNCDLCFLKGTSILGGLIIQKPERAIWWANMEKQTGGRFSNDKPTYAQMMQFQKDQISLFDDESLECFCGD
jgi:3'-phosphoadenosine 5'-phosphosulfate sulfotransferase (PAPS reductase)/FAD synthetase